MQGRQAPQAAHFNPRSPRGGATARVALRMPAGDISIHAPHEGERHNVKYIAADQWHFNPRSPRGGATCAVFFLLRRKVYFNPRSPRGGATVFPALCRRKMLYFNPRSPRGGATRGQIIRGGQACHFNPRSPRGGATIDFSVKQITMISIHAPHEGERQTRFSYCLKYFAFQSTLPTRGSDFAYTHHIQHNQQFQSTLPTRGSDAHVETLGYSDIAISIHAPHEGERQNAFDIQEQQSLFQSTLPTRGSDLNAVLYSKQELTISIHAPHEGERRIRFLQELDTGYISIHAPHEGERRCCSGHKCDTKLISIHAPHEGERLVESPSIIIVSVFQSTLPTRGSDFQSMHALRP